MGLKDVFLLRFRPAVLAMIAIGFGCSTTVEDRVGRGVAWDVDRTEVISWTADDPNFSQDYELEASGMAVSSGFLVVPSEKYSRLLVIDAKNDHVGRVVRLDVPRHAELEGIAMGDGSIFLCDEAHAAVYEIQLKEGEGLADLPSMSPLPTKQLNLEGIAIKGGKIGFEGIEFDARTGRIVLLLERSGNELKGCTSRIYLLRREGEGLELAGDVLDIALEDCNWRLTALAWREGRLTALKTQYPGERYEVVDVDLETGKTEILLDLTAMMREFPAKGWSNNIEGMAISADGALWLVSDSAVTGVIDDPLPPRGDQRTLLVRIPPAEGR